MSARSAAKAAKYRKKRAARYTGHDGHPDRSPAQRAAHEPPMSRPTGTFRWPGCAAPPPPPVIFCRSLEMNPIIRSEKTLEEALAAIQAATRGPLPPLDYTPAPPLDSELESSTGWAGIVIALLAFCAGVAVGAAL